MGRKQQCDAASQVFVGGTLLVNNNELRDHFESYGTVLSVRVPYDRAGRRRGFSFIQFKHATSAQQASLDGLQHEMLVSLSLYNRCARIQKTHIPDRHRLSTVKTQNMWPHLSMVILQDDNIFPSAIQPSDISIANILVSAARARSQGSVSMLRPLHNLAIDPPCACLAAQQLAHQMRLRWPLMSSFTVSHVHGLDGLGLEIVSQLVTGRWTRLARLYLSDCDLRAEGFLLLGQGNWPCLMWLDVSGSSLDAAGMAWLAKGNWPELWSITLSFNPTLGAMAVAQLGAANWPIDTLVIKDAPFSTDKAAALADLQLPKLSELRLMGSRLTAAAVSELARADWPRLRDISINHDDLDAVAVVVGLSPEKVEELKSNASLNAQYCAFAVSEQRMLSWPDMGLWPNLSRIRISKRNVHLWL